jgi:glutathione S-transferase
MKVFWIRAQAPRRVLALLKHLGVDAELVEVDMMAGGLKDPAYVALNPNMKARRWSMATWCCGNRRRSWLICVSSTIRTCGRRTTPQSKLRCCAGCPGATHTGRRRYRAFTSSISSKRPSAWDRLTDPQFEARIPDLVRYATVLDGHLDGRSHVACGRLTIADFQLASMATYWRESEMPLGSFRNIVRWIDNLMRLPAWADPWPAGAATRS